MLCDFLFEFCDGLINDDEVRLPSRLYDAWFMDLLAYRIGRFKKEKLLFAS